MRSAGLGAEDTTIDGPVKFTLPGPVSPCPSYLALSRIRERGPITVAEFMEIALYHPEHGYYATAPQRSGRDGDFFTSVDVGPLSAS